MILAAAYCRFSSHSQRDVSIDQQKKAIQAYADRHGMQIAETYEDRAMTGTNDRRPGFQQMIRDASHASWQYVIVYSLDRFARDRYDSAVYKRQLKSYGIKVLSAMENISDDPSGILMESLLEGLAEYYSKELSQKIRRGMADNASKCLVNGSLPLGYNRAPDGTYAVNEAEKAVVLEIFKRVESGEHLIAIINDLNARCILTKRKRPWTRSSFSKMLSNETYIGTYEHSGIRTEHGVPAIVPEELFYAVQNRLKTKANPRAINGAPVRRRQENGTYILTGKIFCGECKSAMVGISGRSKSGTMHYYYTCRSKKQEHSCNKKNVPRDLIERTVACSLRERMLNNEAISILADCAIEYQQAHDGHAELEATGDRLSAVEKSIANILKAIEAGIITETTQARLLELEAEKKEIQIQLENLKLRTADQISREEIIAALEMFQNGDIYDKDFQEALIDAFLVAVYVYEDNRIRVAFRTGDGTQNETELPFDIDSVCISDPELHHFTLYEHFIFIDGFFVYETEIPAR